MPFRLACNEEKSAALVAVPSVAATDGDGDGVPLFGAAPRWLRLSTPNTRTHAPIDFALPSAAAATGAVQPSAGRPVPSASSGTGSVTPFSPRAIYLAAQAQLLQQQPTGSLTAAENTRVALMESRHELELATRHLRQAQLGGNGNGNSGKDGSAAAATTGLGGGVGAAIDTGVNMEKLLARRQLFAQHVAGTSAATLAAASEERHKRVYRGRALSEHTYLKQPVKAGDSNLIISAGEMHYFKFVVLPVSTGNKTKSAADEQHNHLTLAKSEHAPSTGNSNSGAGGSSTSASSSNPYAHAVYPSIRVELELDCIGGASVRLMSSLSTVALSSPLEKGCAWWSAIESKDKVRTITLQIRGGTVATMGTGMRADTISDAQDVVAAAPPTAAKALHSAALQSPRAQTHRSMTSHANSSSHTNALPLCLAAPHGFTTSHASVSSVPNYSSPSVMARYVALAALTKKEQALISNEGAVVLFISVWADRGFRIRASSFTNAAAAPSSADVHHRATIAQVGGAGGGRKGTLGGRRQRGPTTTSAGNSLDFGSSPLSPSSPAAASSTARHAHHANANANANSMIAQPTTNNTNPHGPGLTSTLTVSDLSALQDLRSSPGVSANARQSLALRLALLEQDPAEREQFEQRVAAIRRERMQQRNRYLGLSRAVRDTGDAVLLQHQARQPLPPTLLTRVPEGAVASCNALLTNRLLVRGDGQGLRERHEAWVAKHSERVVQTKSNAAALEERRRERAAQLAAELDSEEQRIDGMHAQMQAAWTARERALWEEQQHELRREHEAMEAFHAAEVARLAAHEAHKAARLAARVARKEAQAAEEARLEEIAYQARKAELEATGHLSVQGIVNAAAKAALAAAASGAPTYDTPTHHSTGAGRTGAATSMLLSSTAPPPLHGFFSSGALQDSGSTSWASDNAVLSAAEAEARVVAGLRREIEAGLADEQHAFLQASLVAAQAQMARADALKLAKQREAERERDQSERERDAAALAAAGSTGALTGRRLHSRQNSVLGAKLFAALALNSALLSSKKPSLSRLHSQGD